MADQQDTTLPVEPPPADEQETTLPVEQSPADNEQETTLSAEQPPADNEQETTLPAEQPPANNEQETTLPTEQPPADNEQETTLPTEQPPADNEQETTLPSEQPPADNEQETTLPSEQPLADNEQETTLSAEKPSADEQETTLPVEQPQANEQETTLPREQPPADEQETTLPMEQPLVTLGVEEKEKAELKYLEFVKGVMIYAIVCLITLYECAKDNSGPLKAGVNVVEGSVKTVIRPVYNSFRHVPFQLLKFIDCKIDETIIQLDHLVPAMVKSASSGLLLVIQKAPEVVREVASEVEQGGLVDATSNIVKRVYISYEPTVKELYNKYEPIAEKYAVSTWSKLNQLPLFPIVAHIVVPTAAYWAEKYNQVVATAIERGTVLCYLPLIPIDKIAKAFENNGDGHTSFTNDDSVALSQ